MRALAPLALVLALASSGCRFDSFFFYDVNRSFTDECDILPQGEFCDEPEGLSPPVFEVWAIERVDGEVRIVVDEEVWIADVDPENADHFTSSKREVATVAPGPCTTTTSRSFDIVAIASPDPAVGILTGELQTSQRLTGPDDCGETPRGLRTVQSLNGSTAGAP